MKKIVLTPKLAEKIQDEIYYNMPSEKKIRLTSQFFMLGKKLKESKTILKNDAGRSISKNS
jgi:hypothetical protein